MLIAAIVAVLTTAFLILVMRMPLPGILGEYLAGVTLPQELRSAVLISDREDGTSVLYHARIGGLNKESLDAGLISASLSNEQEARIERAPDGTFKVSVNETTIIQDAYPRVGVSVSPSGTRVAFAQAIDTQAFVSPAQAPALALDRKRWEVVVYEPSTRTTSTLGTGVLPVFIDDTHVVWLAPAGIAVADLVNGQTQVLLSDTTGRAASVSLVSPDRTLVAWYAPKDQQLTLYRMSAGEAVALPPVSVPSPVRSLALTNDAVYIIRSVGFGTEILKQPIAGGEAVSVVRLPSSMRIQRLLFGSI